jgi:hypothetical protein
MGIMLDQPDQIRAWFMLSQLGALRLEIKGMRHSSGRSIAKHIRDTYGLQCGRKKIDVLWAFQVYLLHNAVLTTEGLRDTELIHLYVKETENDAWLAKILLAEFDKRGWRNKRGQITAKYRRALIEAQRHDLV